MFSGRQSIMPLGRPGRDTVGETELEDHMKSAQRIMKKMGKSATFGYRAANCLRSEALQIDRLIQVLDCKEFAVLMPSDSTQRHQESLKAEIEPQIEELLKMREQRKQDRDKKEERAKRSASTMQNTGTPRSDVAAVRREQLLLQRKERLKKDNQALQRQLTELS
ncbi:hypothetical protein FRC14_006399 [Serendipita sp. 396]|nr:hypothetical protein FRC14_006399 [Serendipita sp. 396]KAG8786925.1 hypothetical protein FRC15_010418 [Serendipita sp. 397]KAG8802421.1 hypothetical protein FRC16_009700 [Serendipita sp. 398]KAG8824529.1 hypothetical protein FRC19_001627 [Serendipita sp. 401]KAG8858073.1 hypothetical protein FRB91_010462 [Serendipita sp. 411]KAG8871633.1 hypothetical protein FRC20_010353 [Serendipita sp. 405]KAG9055277.1 hypothetical protein FS842_002607 [Serendipita sp. 407]